MSGVFFCRTEQIIKNTLDKTHTLNQKTNADPLMCGSRDRPGQKIWIKSFD